MLGQLNPRSVLARGYAIVLDEQRRHCAGGGGDLPQGEELNLLFAKDSATARFWRRT